MGENLVNALKGYVPFESLYSFVFIEKVGKTLLLARGTVVTAKFLILPF